LALPRGQRQSNKDNHLAESGTPKHSTGSFGFLPRVSHQDAAGESKPHSFASTLVVIVAPAPRSAGRFEAHLDGDDHVLCVSTTPFLTAARKLVAQGYDLGLTLILRHAGSDTDSLRAKLGTAASLTIKETGYAPQLQPWKPFSTLPVRARSGPGDRAATVLASPTARASVDL
jgi:hypothetical protein